jgi:octaprenyl-diphosphate synthase
MTQTDVSVTELYDSIRSDLRRVEQIFDDELASDVGCVNRLCERVQAYRGKMLRPALLLFSAEAAGGIRPAHHTLAAVVEMVHMATLVHDDVLDGAEERRRRPTVCVTEGNIAAVLLGDYLISHAFHLCSGLRDQHASRRIGATTNIVCEGELLQNALTGDVSVSETQYFEIIRRKTGALTACCAELGAHYAGADAAVTERFYSFGMAVGTAFQIIDDVLDVVGDQAEVGKTLSLDLARGKLTLPTIHCLQHAAPAVADPIRDAIRGKVSVRGEVLRQLLARTGAVEYAVATARTHVDAARECLEGVPPGEAKTALTEMAEFVVSRRF